MRYKMYTIKRTDAKELRINSKEWMDANIAKIDTLNWKDWSYCPDTEFKVMVNDKGLYVHFETDEEELIYDCKNLNEDVYKDSCVEFFFKPDPENENYFNFEVNAIGTPIIGLGASRKRIRLDIKDISIFNFEYEIKEKGFILNFFIPFSFLLQYVDKIGDYFLGNFQKCKEKGNNPHFVTYYPIKTENPDFHRPEYFDKILIELDK